MNARGGHFIGGRWIEGAGPPLVSIDPATGEACWHGREATGEEAAQAIAAARSAVQQWAGLPLEQRIACVERFGRLLEAQRDALAETISIETGKPRWEAQTEVGAMIAKGPASIEAFAERRGRRVSRSGQQRAVMRYRPIGALLVFGPFNFPGHIANGHITPALLAGNAIVFKPSELTPRVAVEMVRLWEAAGLPAGAINLVQGGRDVGAALVGHGGHDGVLFTGSYRTGVALARALADRPHLMLALEMGGNNPLVVDAAADADAAAYLTVQSAYLTAGQRCTCARRLIVPRGPDNDRFIDRLAGMTGRLRIGPHTLRPEPFMGPLISEQAARRVLDEQRRLIDRGTRALIEARPLDDGPAFLSPGLIDATDVADREDREVFGPLLQLIRVDDFDAAIAEANRTAYGLAAGLLSDDERRWRRFVQTIRAGIVNWNRQTTGASGRLPFGGVGRSGNHRPAGYFAIDYCNDPLACLELPTLRMPAEPTPGIDPRKVL